jgi:AcrR family transcriptional regulator
MAGRKQFDVDVAVDRAMRTFWEHGYHGSSLDMLTAAMGIGRGSFYTAFGSKDRLFRAALDRYSRLYGGDNAAALAQPDPVRAYFEALLRRMLDPSVPGGCLVTQSAALASELDPESRATIVELLDSQRRALTAAGLTDPRLVEYVVAVRQSLAVLHRAGAGADSLRAVVELACRTVADAQHQAGETGPGIRDRPQPAGR